MPLRPRALMPQSPLAILLVVILALGGCTTTATTLAIWNVTVLPLDGTPARPGATVLIRGNRIASITPSAGAKIPTGALVVDGTNQYLIPGLWDMHVHLSKTRASSLALFVANGVTGVRDMGGDHPELRGWRREIRSGERPGPRILLAGPYLESADNVARMRGTAVEEMAEPVERTRIPVGSPAEAARIVDSLARAGVDMIKIRTVQDSSTYLAIAASARARGLPLVGHAFGIRPAQLIASGQRSIEHVLLPTLDELGEPGRARLWQELTAQGTGTVPTLVTVVASALASDSVAALALEGTTGATFPWRRYLSRYLVIDWREQFAERSPSQAGMYRTFAPRALRNLREMRAARIPMMPGTDAGVFLIWPGASLHDELALFVSELGMTPTEALASGTRVATGFLGLADSLGIIAVGKVADLVLLEADPLADIRNTRRIRGLVLDGRWYDRSALDRLLEATRAAPDRTVNDWPRRAR